MFTNNLIEDYRNKFNSLIEWKVYLENTNFIHDFYYKDNLIYSYKINENDTKTKIPEILKFKMNNYMNLVVNIGNEIEVKLGSIRDNFIKETFINTLLEFKLKNLSMNGENDE